MNDNGKTVRLQGAVISNSAEFHQQLKVILALPDYYGANLDALWDVLTGWIELPLVLEWSDFQVSRARMGEYADRALQVFRDAERELEGFQVVCAGC